MFSRREYEYVMEIAKEGSFSKAAQKLYVSQPALSGAIKKLEKDLYGIPLFDRAVTPVALTPAGQYYLEQARKIYELRNEIEHHFADLAGIRTIRGLKDGSFKVISTDHAPHAVPEKTGSIRNAGSM